MARLERRAPGIDAAERICWLQAAASGRTFRHDPIKDTL